MAEDHGHFVDGLNMCILEIHAEIRAQKMTV